MRRTSQRRVHQLHEQLKPVSHSTKCSSGASRLVTAIFIDGCSCHQKVRRHRSRRRFAQPLSTIILKGAPCRLMSWHFSLFFETHYWHQKGRPGLSVSAASLCDLPAVTPTSGKTTCSQYLWYDALATTFCSYLGSAVTRRYATYTFE